MKKNKKIQNMLSCYLFFGLSLFRLNACFLTCFRCLLYERRLKVKQTFWATIRLESFLYIRLSEITRLHCLQTSSAARRPLKSSSEKIFSSTSSFNDSISMAALLHHYFFCQAIAIVQAEFHLC